MRALLVAALLFPLPALAWVPSGFTWDRPPPYEINAASAAELGAQTAVAVVQQSYANWTAPGCSGFSSQYTGEVNTSWNSRDRTNTHVWIYDPNSRPRELGGRQTIGVTLSVFSGRQAIDGDILYNGIDHAWTTNPVRNGQVDAESIITHETGHQLGLNHSASRSATMYAAYLGGTGARSLDPDDIQGVCSLYPSGAAPECQGDGDCGEGEQCFGGACIEAGGAGDGDVGDACGPNGECGGGNFCVQDPTGDVFCTRECGGGCPNGWECQRVGINGRAVDLCLEGNGGQPPAQAGFGEPCQGAADCTSNLCLSDGQNAFCSQLCQDNSGCPAGAGCVQLQGGGGACVPGQAPPPIDAAPPPPHVDMEVPNPELDGGVAQDASGPTPQPETDAAVPINPQPTPGEDQGGPFRVGSDGGLLRVGGDEGGSSGCSNTPGAPIPSPFLLLLALPLIRRFRESGF